MDVAQLKKEAAERAVACIENGMVIGLGHGSTAAFAVRAIARRINEGSLRDVVAVACSTEVEQLARSLHIPLSTLERTPAIDCTIDGADEVDSNMNLIKGGGGALLREKIVATASHREIIIVDGSKLSPQLGTRFPLPVEVVPFAWVVEQRFLISLGAAVSKRGGELPFVSDEGNVILDCQFGPIEHPEDLAQALDRRPGIVAHGLFLGLATDLIVADESGVHQFSKGSDLTEVMPS